MTDKIARVWNGSEWVVVSAPVGVPNSIAVYQQNPPESPVDGQMWVDSDNDETGNYFISSNMDLGLLVIDIDNIQSQLDLKSPIASPTFTGITTSASSIVTGNFAVDTNTFFVDSANDRVGIKTSSPSAPLHISHSGETIRIADGTRTMYLGVDANNPWIGTSTDHDIRFVTNAASRMRLNNAGHLVPETTNTYDLGTTSLRWRNIFTQDLHLSNGIGDYTIVEGEEDLFLINNKSGKSYKFMLSEVDSSEVPSKSEV